MKILSPTLIFAALVSGSSASAWAPSAPFRTTRDFSVMMASTSTVNGDKHVGYGSLSTEQYSSTEAIATEVAEPQVATATDPQSDSKYEVYQLPATTPAPVVSIPTIASVFVATVGTFFLNNYMNMGPVKASSIAGIIATMILPEKLALAAFCGSFAGMAKPAVIPGMGASAVLGLICAYMISLFDYKKWLVGVGGRLGFIAQCACTLQFLIMSIFATPAAPAALVSKAPINVKGFITDLPAVALSTVVGAVFMRYWKRVLAEKSKRLSNSVGAVGATGLISSFLLPASMAGPAFCGSFVAMAAPTKLPTMASLYWASILAGISQLSMGGVLLGGWGGKLGTAALMGVLIYNGIVDEFKTKSETSAELSQPQMAGEARAVPSPPQPVLALPEPAAVNPPEQLQSHSDTTINSLPPPPPAIHKPAIVTDSSVDEENMSETEALSEAEKDMIEETEEESFSETEDEQSFDVAEEEEDKPEPPQPPMPPTPGIPH